MVGIGTVVLTKGSASSRLEPLPITPRNMPRRLFIFRSGFRHGAMMSGAAGNYGLNSDDAAALFTHERVVSVDLAGSERVPRAASTQSATRARAP